MLEVLSWCGCLFLFSIGSFLALWALINIAAFVSGCIDLFKDTIKEKS
jgi:hypothetical protein